MPSERLRSYLAFFAYFCAICAIPLAAQAGWQHHQRAGILQTWPRVEAKIRHCSRGTSLYSSKGGTRAFVNVSCYITFTVNGDPYGTNLESRWQGDNGPVVASSGSTSAGPRLTVVEQRLYDWMSAHPEGTEIYVRYNPSNPRETSVVGMDPVIDIDPVRQSLRGARTFMILATICVAARWAVGRMGNQAVPGLRSAASVEARGSAL